MPQRQGGGGGGGGHGSGGRGADFSLRQGLRELLDRVDREASNGGHLRGGASGVRGSSRGRDLPSGGSNSVGARPANQARAAGGDRPSQPGDWTCGSCGFRPNFARRRNCFSCRRPRSPRPGGGTTAGGGVSGLTRGPVGAGGLRPMLGGKGAGSGGGGGAARPADQPPTHRVQGASVAARAAAAAGTGSWVDVAKRAGTGSTAAASRGSGGADRVATSTDGGGGNLLDGDGFQTVTRRGARRSFQAEGTGDDVDGEVLAASGVGGEGTDGREDDDKRQEGGNDGAELPNTADLQKAWHK